MWCEAHVLNYSNITAATGHDAVLHTIPMPTVCDSVSWIIEVSKGYQSVHMSVPMRDYYSEIICIIPMVRKIHRSHKQLPCGIHGFLREPRKGAGIDDRLCSAIHGSVIHRLRLTCRLCLPVGIPRYQVLAVGVSGIGTPYTPPSPPAA